MVDYEPTDSEVEVNGQTVLSVVNAFPDALTRRGESILADNGIENPEEGEWYPQEYWLDAFSDIHESMGESTLERIGKSIPRSAEWPPGTDTIVAGVESIDTAYHMNHRGGEIGNYEAEQIDETRIHVTCDNPYPCAFDTGILKGVVDEFGEERARVREIGAGCRAEGDDHCLYEIEW
jgi:predicted hydrocarbon binding protein